MISMFRVTSLLFTALVLFGCNSKFSDEVDANLQREAASNRVACEEGKCPCDTPKGSIAHGSKVTVYSSELADCEKACGDYAVEATCNNGEFDQDITGRFFSCVVEECPSCFLGKNLVRHGETIKTYKTREVGCRDSCDNPLQNQLRTCNRGVLSGEDEFFNVSCKRKECRCELPDQSAFVSLDSKIDLFSQKVSSCESTCADFKQTRTCLIDGIVDGKELYALDGDDAFENRSCSEPNNCYCTLPNNLGVLAHESSKVLYSQPTVECGETCEALAKLNVKCINGGFVEFSDANKKVDFTKAPYTQFIHECKAKECTSCQVPGTNISVLHNATYRFAKESSPVCGNECEFSDRKCVNGNFQGDTQFSKASCELRKCKCDVPNSNDLTVAVNSSWPFYSKAKAQCGQTCGGDLSADKICKEFSEGNGSYRYDFASTPAGYNFDSCSEATGCSCALPGGLGFIEDKKTVRLTSQETISCGTSCDEVASLKAKCDNGKLLRTTDNSEVNTSDPNFPFKYFCKQAGCAACQLPGYGSIASGKDLTLYSKEKLECSDKPELFTFEFSCQNSVLLRNGNQYDPNNDPNAPETWFTSYQLDCDGCDLPWGGRLREGASVNAYKFFGTVVNGCGRGCKVTERKCENGNLTGDDSYDMSACDNSCVMDGGGAPPQGCLLRWQNSMITPDSQVPVWSKRSVPCGDSCQNYFKLARCQMLSGTFDAPFEYLYQSCTELCPAN